MAVLEFMHILWKASKSTIVLMHNKSVTRFFQTKAIPPSLWSACNYVLQFIFKIAHSVGSFNIAANFLSRLELKVTEKIRLKVWEDVHTTPIEVTTSSSDAADEKHIFKQRVGENENEEKILQRKQQSWKNMAEKVVNEEPS